MKIRRVFNISIPMFSSMMILLGMSLSSSALDFPGPKPGAAHSQVVDQHELRLFNDLISFSWSTSGDILKPVSVINLLSGEKIDLKNREIFVIELGGGEIKSSEMRISDSRKPLQQTLTGDSNASTLSKRHPGRQFELVLTASDPRCTIIWRAELRDGANAIRQSIEILPFSDPCLIKQIQLIALPSQGVAPGGAVPGSPLMLNHFFWAYEHPNAEIHSNANEAQCFLRLHQVLQPGEALAQSWAVGVAPEDQMRRAFLYYIERERAHPYRPFLHYNSWYDICWGNQKINEEQCLKVIDGFGQELIRKRNVKLASFVWDDGWDDPATLWRPVTKNFPNGFSTMLQTARSYGSTLGFWLSPFGGYGQPAKDRLTFGKEQGFEFKNDKFSLAGAKYYERFLETCSTFIQRDGANFFKFDGLTRDVSETQAMLRLTQALRKLDQDLFISITTGTWPSPFWLWYGDSTWRGDGDMGFHGPGPKREQWITYRDMTTYKNVVRPAPFYPLNSLMNQGIAKAHYGAAKEAGNTPVELRNEIRSFFACGTCLQELYISPDMMTQENWDDLAEGAAWSQANADVLVDAHWIGGDPGRGEAYGWASWSKRKGILGLRNPAAESASIALDIGKAFELPADAPPNYRLQSPWKSDAGAPAVHVKSGESVTFQLKPFEVQVYDAWIE